MSQRNTIDVNNHEHLPAWLASILMKQGNNVLPRFAAHLNSLATRPRAWRRRLRRQLALTVTGAALLLALAGASLAPIAQAETNNVITVANGKVRVVDDGQCSLSEAIKNANNQTTGRPFDDCAAGNPTGADTIVLPTNGVFTLTSVDNSGEYGANGLPWIGTSITIAGNNSTIQRSPTAAEFRIIAVGPSGNLGLQSVIISNGALPSTNPREGGAGILNQGSLILQDTTVADNHINSAVYALGGGIHSTGTLTISNSLVRDNSATGSSNAVGGGIFVDGSASISYSTVSGNIARSLGDYSLNPYPGVIGGGIASSADLTISNSTISTNKAYGEDAYSSYGGGVFVGGRTAISKSTISNNRVQNIWDTGAGGDGSGIVNSWYGQLELSNTTISGNEAPGKGAAVLNRNDAYLYNTTITNNVGNGITTYCDYRFDSDYPKTVINRSIISGNSRQEASVGIFSFCYSDLVFVDHHNIFGHSGDAGVYGFLLGDSDIVPAVGIASILGGLANNGGPTLTHALPIGSPAIDQAENWTCNDEPVSGRDQRGQPRNVNGRGGMTENECDIGAFEAQATVASPKLLISPATSGTVGGVTFTPADILRYDPATQGWSLYFKASRVGVTKNLSGFEVDANGDILMSFAASQAIAGAGTFTPQDIARFRPTQTGPNTAGTFSWALDGSTRGLTTSGEKIDALGMTIEGFWALSTGGAAAVTRLNGAVQKAQDEDALGFNPATNGWWLYFDGTQVPGLGVEDVNALWIDPATGDLYISIIGAFNLSGVRGDGKDIVKLTMNAAGGYSPSLYWDGSAAGFPSTIDGLELIP